MLTKDEQINWKNSIRKGSFYQVSKKFTKDGLELLRACISDEHFITNYI